MEEAYDNSQEADRGPLWYEGTYLTEILELDYILQLTPSQQPTTGLLVPIRTEKLVCEPNGDLF